MPRLGTIYVGPEGQQATALERYMAQSKVPFEQQSRAEILAARAAAGVKFKDDAPNTRSATEAWLESLGSTFREARLYVKGAWVEERHVDDNETLETTIQMSLERLGGTHAVYLCPDGHWACYSARKGTATCYPTQEAAEMIAIHNV